MSRRQVKKWGSHTVDDLRERWGREDVHLFGVVDSTNDAVAELADEGAPEGTIVLAREQTAGRGREGRKWESPSGGVYLSMLFRPGGDLSPLLSLLAGLGIVRKLDREFAELSPALKWPNDIMADDGKLGGVLAEATWGENGRPRYLVVGAGLNIEPITEGLTKAERTRATSLTELVENATAAQAADAIVAGLEMYLRQPPSALDAAALELIDRYDWLRNRRAVVRSSAQSDGLSGIGVGIAPDGALLFRPDRGALRRIVTGTVEAEAP